MTVLLEALNPTETPRYLLHGTDAVLDMIERVGRPNVAFQLDVYHVAMAGEDPIESIRRAGSHIGHVQLADVPGRHEPGTGSLPFPAILDALDQAGYAGAIGLEFNPLDPPRRTSPASRGWAGALAPGLNRTLATGAAPVGCGRRHPDDHPRQHPAIHRKDTTWRPPRRSASSASGIMGRPMARNL